MSLRTVDALINLTTEATREAVRDLFASHPCDEFYYVSLISTWSLPFLTAWSTQALASTAAAQGCEPSLLKWSYADSPYCAYRLDLFEPLRDHFESLSGTLGAPDSEHPIDLALRVSESVMARLDSEGLFGTGEPRKRIVVGAEVMPPDWTNTDRLKRLNPENALSDWLREAAEPPPGATGLTPPFSY